MLTIMYPLRMEWTEDGAKHTVEWSFHGGQREGIIEAVFRVIKEEKEKRRAKSFEASRKTFPEVALNCPTCLRKVPKRQGKKKVDG